MNFQAGQVFEVFYYCRWRKCHVVGYSKFGGTILEMFYEDGRPPLLVRWDSTKELKTRAITDCS